MAYFLSNKPSNPRQPQNPTFISSKREQTKRQAAALAIPVDLLEACACVRVGYHLGERRWCLRAYLMASRRSGSSVAGSTSSVVSTITFSPSPFVAVGVASLFPIGAVEARRWRLLEAGGVVEGGRVVGSEDVSPWKPCL